MVATRFETRSEGEDPPALATALELLERGLWPIPITAPDDPKATSPGKQPLGLDWGRNRHTPETLRAVWARHPKASVGIKLGKDGTVIDIEVEDRVTGEESLWRLLGGELPATLGWSSARGDHRLFAFDDRLARYGKAILKLPEFPGIEIRIGATEPDGKQFQSVCPPSPTTEGIPRQWNGSSEILELPEAFYVALDPLLLARSEPVRPVIPIRGGLLGGPTVEDRARAYLEKLPEAVEHQRGHDRLYRAACVLVEGFALSYQQALPILRDWNQVHALPPESEKQVEHKLTDALKNATRHGYLLHAERDPNQPRPGPGERQPAPGPAPAEDESTIVAREWPDPLGEAAYHGLAGELVRALEPHTESDPVAILVQLLVAFGNMAGRSAYFAVEADRHYPNLFATLVGPSAKARKGTSWGHARRLLGAIDRAWAESRILGGLSSGEGLIWAVRDPITRRDPVRSGKNGPVISYEQVTTDPGVDDKRLLALEPELASPLKALAREGNTLSALLRRAWDDGNLRILTKNSPAVSTGAHVSIIGHITKDELQRLMTGTEAANGFGNRFLWFCVRRSKLLPFGGLAHTLDFAPMLRQLSAVVEVARMRQEMARDGFADELWLDSYARLSEGKPGLLGAIVGRAEAQVMRLALIYALLDGAEAIGRPHLEAALALWRYAEDSARFVFGDALGDDEAEAILAALRACPDGMTRSQISAGVFNRNKTSPEITRALTRLLEYGLVRRDKVPTGGRPAETWFATSPGTPS